MPAGIQEGHASARQESAGIVFEDTAPALSQAEDLQVTSVEAAPDSGTGVWPPTGTGVWPPTARADAGKRPEHGTASAQERR
ncbi:MAG TPA: hypothetical protein VKV80_17935 [Streptosporangiaceae bacterium]|nr:hypothetical protein [Streptosporangiaceae bacterium]